MISDLKIEANDIELTQYFDLLNEPDRGLFPTLMNETATFSHRSGNRVINSRFGSREIALDFYAYSDNARELKDVLAKILYMNTVRLWFSDEPDRYFNARLDEESSMRRDEKSRSEYTGTLRFIVEDGVAHSVNTKKFVFTNGETSVDNNGTYPAPLDIHVTFTSDANSIGFVSDKAIVQLGTAYSEDDDNFIPSSKIVSDPMNSSQKNSWSENIARPRWRNDDSENASKVMGTLDWNDARDGVYVKSWGTIDPSKPGFWHGPSVTRFFNDPLDNLETIHRFNFKPVNGKYGKKGAQGLVEINYPDADSNFVFGFEMKDNTDKKEEITYKFFVGTTTVYSGKLPNSIATNAGGFFGSIAMSKVGNKFVFKLARLQGSPLKETWSVSKTFYNETVAMLSPARVDIWMSQWKNFTTMDLGITDVRVVKINTEDDTLVPLTFYKGDELFVDSESNRVYINGIRNDNYRVVGSSQFLEAPLDWSSYSVLSDGTYTGYLEMRERYL